LVTGTIVAVVVAVALSVWVAAGVIPTVGIETLSYVVVERSDGYEVREYAPYLLAEVEVGGDRGEALREGFRTLFAYISGANEAAKKVAMTAPVIEADSGPEQIAMTAPVLEEPRPGTRRVAFVVPAAYTAETAPRPTNPAVSIRSVGPERVACLRFTGRATDKQVAAKTEVLFRFLARDRREPIGPPRVAQYNPPWTPFFLRRNEILVTVR
jgi:hypothetical protein